GAIVVLENTHRYIDRGTPPAQAALEAAGEVAMPVLTATIATIVIFFPVVFLTGIGRFLFTPLAVAVALAIAASYFVGMMVVPAFSAHFLEPRSADGRPESHARSRTSLTARFEAWFERLRDRYEIWALAALRRRRLLIGCSLLAFTAALLLTRF